MAVNRLKTDDVLTTAEPDNLLDVKAQLGQNLLASAGIFRPEASGAGCLASGLASRGHLLFWTNLGSDFIYMRSH